MDDSRRRFGTGKQNKKAEFGRSGDFETGADGIIEGRNPVTEAIKAGRKIDKLYVSKDGQDSALRHLIAQARNDGASIIEVDRKKLDQMSLTRAHQGVIATMPVREYADIDDILTGIEPGKIPLIIVCDKITDPNNLGAIIRTAEVAGADAVVIPKRRSAGLTATVAKASAGAVEHIPVAKVSNITAFLKKLKEEGFWIFGAAGGEDTGIYDVDMTVPAAIVIGSEGDGISRLVMNECDYLVSIPMFGKIDSLNASAAAAIIIYEAVRQRIKKAN